MGKKTLKAKPVKFIIFYKGEVEKVFDKELDYFEYTLSQPDNLLGRVKITVLEDGEQICYGVMDEKTINSFKLHGDVRNACLVEEDRKVLKSGGTLIYGCSNYGIQK